MSEASAPRDSTNPAKTAVLVPTIWPHAPQSPFTAIKDRSDRLTSPRDSKSDASLFDPATSSPYGRHWERRLLSSPGPGSPRIDAHRPNTPILIATSYAVPRISPQNRRAVQVRSREFACSINKYPLGFAIHFEIRSQLFTKPIYHQYNPYHREGVWTWKPCRSGSNQPYC